MDATNSSSCPRSNKAVFRLRHSHRTDAAADVAIDAVESAEMRAEHKPLDGLLV